jgi:hypothetical protein
MELCEGSQHRWNTGDHRCGFLFRVRVAISRRAIRGLARLRKRYGGSRWRKLKGIARVRLIDGTIHAAEIHWYEAHGIGRKELKIKFPLLD